MYPPSHAARGGDIDEVSLHRASEGGEGLRRARLRRTCERRVGRGGEEAKALYQLLLLVWVCGEVV